LIKLNPFYQTPASTGAVSSSTTEDATELRRQIALYRKAIDDFQEDNRDNQAKAILDLDLVKRADLTAALDKCKALEQGQLWRRHNDVA
jgi:hypothetical protein